MVSAYAIELIRPAARVPSFTQHSPMQVPKRNVCVIFTMVTLCRNKLLAASTGFWTVVVCIS